MQLISWLERARLASHEGRPSRESSHLLEEADEDVEEALHHLDDSAFPDPGVVEGVPASQDQLFNLEEGQAPQFVSFR